jgi:FMN phosphatase YigB (HAD superfamily)
MMLKPVHAICFDWGGTLMKDEGPSEIPMAQWPEVMAIRGARETLAALHSRYVLCVATNARASGGDLVLAALERVDLARYISQVFCQVDLKCGKGTVEFWQIVEATLGFPLSSVLMVGDTLETDVIVPARYGVQSVWFNEGGRRPSPSCNVPIITEISELVAQLG